jgi:O-antigen ligase
MYKNLNSFYINNRHKKLCALIIFTWISLWFSIGTNFEEIQGFKNSLAGALNASRVLLVIFFFTLSISLTLFILIKKFSFKLNKNFNNNLLLILFVYFTLQIIGLYENSYKEFNLNNLYLTLLSIGTLNIFILVNLLELEKILKYLLYISILIVFLFFSVVILSKMNNLLFNVHTSDLYSFIHPNEIILGHEYPRITGLSRMLAVVNIALIIYFNPTKNFLSLLLFTIILIFSTLIWGMQSRGTIICFFVSLIIIIFFLKNLKFYKALIFFFILIAIPIIIFESIRVPLLKKKEINYNNYKNDNVQSKDNDNVQSKDKELEIRLLKTKHTSGRTDLWETAIKKYEKNKFFGYGPQADRFLLTDLHKLKHYGSNVSNGIIYAFLCSGYIAIIIFLFIYYKIAYLIYNFFYKKIYLRKLDISIKISIVLLIFFSIRSLIENSFSLFSIDFLLFLISITIVENYLTKKHNNSHFNFS